MIHCKQSTSDNFGNSRKTIIEKKRRLAKLENIRVGKKIFNAANENIEIEKRQKKVKKKRHERVPKCKTREQACGMKIQDGDRSQTKSPS